MKKMELAQCNMMSKQTDGQSYIALDLAKFICAIFVVMIHIAPFGNTETNSIIRYLNFGIQQYLARIAVPFFFVASGFLLFLKMSLSSFNPEIPKKYVVRIFRLYVIWLLIYFPLYFHEFFKDKKGIGHAILVYLRDIALSGSYKQLWYLYAVIIAVIIVSFLLYRKIQPLKVVIFATILYIVGLFAQSWFGFITPLRKVAPVFWNLLKLF